MNVECVRLRAEIAAGIRRFFARRNVLEVHTPVITDSGVTDLHIESLSLADGRFLRTSPEYSHKRLLAAGAGDLYELGPVFRAGEHGRLHREEFLLLEWYRLGWDWQSLANEVIELIDSLTPNHDWTITFVAWRDLLQRTAGIDPETADNSELRTAAPGAPDGLDRPELLDWVFATRLQPGLPAGQLTVVHDFPACQAALARLKPGEPQWAERFEVFAGSVELANGYRELTDPVEQQRRFKADNLRRQSLGRARMPIDRDLIAALESGLPDCSGVALGVDRLMMIAGDTEDIAGTRLFS
ncbi:MAG: EF-P lysine aminoacylase EpmA [Wenzhouxiangellaceae bacterium]